MLSMSVAFRVDASVEVGSGHLMRCLALADSMRLKGIDVVFVCRKTHGSMANLIASRGYESESIGGPECDFEKDAQEARNAIIQRFPNGVSWLVVDHYGLDSRWEILMRPVSQKIMVIDDIANRPHLCDLLLDQNYENPLRYQGLVPENCKQLLGPAYALLRPEYAKYRSLKNFRRRSPERIFVFFGGSDPADLTGKTLKALMTPALLHLEVDIVVGGNYAHHQSLNTLALERGHTTVHGPQLHLAALMLGADLAVGAGGVTNWERMTLGLPSLVITQAENQVPISDQLHHLGVIRLIGTSDEASVEHIRDALLDEIQSQRYLDRIAPSMAMCDGQGVERVLHEMQ